MANEAVQRINEEERSGGALELSEWTPESLRAAIVREKQLRSIVIEYYQGAMQESHHYYNLPGAAGRKPALSKEGALNLCSLFKVTPSPDDVTETYHDDGHYTVRARCHIIAKNGAIVATGDGLCTSRESKYAHRWMWGSEVPAEISKDGLKKKEWDKGERHYVQYQVPNQDLPDIFNTVLKMATKRALVDATLKLPLVSELFTQDLDEQITGAVTTKAETVTTRALVKDQENRTTKKGNDPVKKAFDLAMKLTERGVDAADVATQFLPEGVEGFKDLTTEQAEAILPAMVDALNATIYDAVKHARDPIA